MGVRKDRQKVWDKWGIVRNAKKGMWEEVLDAGKRGLASEDEVRWEVERGGESEDRLRAWRERKGEAFVKRKGYRARGAR